MAMLIALVTQEVQAGLPSPVKGLLAQLSWVSSIANLLFQELTGLSKESAVIVQIHRGFPS